MEDEFEVSYSLDNEQQFWDGNHATYECEWPGANSTGL